VDEAKQTVLGGLEMGGKLSDLVADSFEGDKLGVA
jgi:hypothetical protein